MGRIHFFAFFIFRIEANDTGRSWFSGPDTEPAARAGAAARVGADTLSAVEAGAAVGPGSEAATALAGGAGVAAVPVDCLFPFPL